MVKRFKVVIEKDPEGGYSLFVPSLSGCASQGETVAEGLANIKEAIALYVESLRMDGLPVPSADIDVMVEDVEVSV